MMNKWLKRIAAVIVLIAISIGTVPVLAASDATAVRDRKAGIAKGLLGALDVKNNLPEDPEAEVTTGQFIYTVLNFLQYNPADGDDAVTMAKQSYILLEANARASEPLTFLRTVQVCLSAIGYNPALVAQGGGESVIRSFANSSKIANDAMAENNAVMKTADLYRILYNFFNADIMTTDYDGTVRVQNGTSIINRLYRLEKISGVLSAVGIADLYQEEGALNRDLVRIGSQMYLSSQADKQKLIGCNVEAYVNIDDNETLYYMHPVKNNEFILNYEDVEAVEGNIVRYAAESSGSVKRIKLDTAYDVIYNGSVYKGADWRDITSESAVLRFLDNDYDSEYEILFISDYKYMKVSAIDPVSGKVFGKNNVSVNLSGDNNGDIEIISGETGKPISINDINTNMLLMIQSSLNGMYMRVETCNNSMNGSVTMLNIGDKRIGIDGTEYRLDGAFASNTGFEPSIGKSYTFYIGANGRIVYADNGISGMRYGYIIKTYRDDGAERSTLRLLDETGTVMDLQIASKLEIDGSSSNDAGAGALAGQLIKYMSNSDNEITRIDTAESVSDRYMDMNTADDHNSLISYDITGDLLYKSSTKMFGDAFCASSAVIFMVPTDLSVTDSSYYNVATTAIFNNDSRYGADVIEAYNVDAYRNAEAVVYRNTSNVMELYGSETKSAVVDKLELVANSDNEIVYNMTYFMDNTFSQAELDEDVSVIKSSGSLIGPGDIVRFSIQNGIIKSLVVDFDAAANVMNKNDASTAEFNSMESRIIQYQSGMIGALKDTNMLLAKPTVLNASRPSDFVWSNLRLTAVPTSNIILVSRKSVKTANGDTEIRNVEVRRIEPYEILTYENSGSDADFAVVRQRYLEPTQLVIYRTR